MARFSIDFGKIENKSFPVYPSGRYNLRIIDARQEASKRSGEGKLTVTFEIKDGPAGSKEYSGKKLVTSYSTQQQAAFRVQRLLLACGFPADQLTSVGDEHLAGCEVSAALSIEDYDGRNVNRVQNEEPTSKMGGAPQAVAPTSFVAPANFAAPPTAPQAQAPAGWAPQQAWAPPPGWTPPGPNGPQGWAPQMAAPQPPPAKPVSK